MYFAKWEVRLFLKARVARISLHEMENKRDFVLQAPHRVAYALEPWDGVLHRAEGATE
jgi:hypothetical protein